MPNETTMIERVARAICKQEYGSENAGWHNQVPAAIAAIAAMREPTEAMLEEASGSLARWAWPAMIDVALKEIPDEASNNG